MKKILSLILTLTFLSACGAQKGKLITKEDFGDSWAFTVNEGYIYSINNAAIFKNEKTEYALNGIAISRGYADLKPIWRANPKYEGMGINISVGPFIELALENPQ